MHFESVYIVMELMGGGELFDYVVQKGTLTEEEASRIVRKVTSALVYMHSKNVIHRDMKVCPQPFAFIFSWIASVPSN